MKNPMFWFAMLFSSLAVAVGPVPTGPTNGRSRLAASHVRSFDVFEATFVGSTTTLHCAVAPAALAVDLRQTEIAGAISVFQPTNPCSVHVKAVSGSHPFPDCGEPVTHPRVNVVDDEILGTLDAVGIPPAPLASDAEFLRRVTVDLTGRIPTADEVADFLADTNPEKRTARIDELIASDGFVDRYTFFLDELFRVTAYSDTSEVGWSGRNAWHESFRSSLQQGRGWNDIARDLMVTSGNSHGAGPVNYTIREIAFDGPAQDTWDNLAAATGSTMLGVNIFCISCHDGAGHTDQLNLWLTSQKRKDLWGMSAFWARTGIRGEYLREELQFVFDTKEYTTGEYLLDTTDGNKTPRKGWEPGLIWAPPKFILTDEHPISGKSRRQEMARMVTSSRQFARNMVNRVWRELMGLGLVEPVDGFDLLRLDPLVDLPEGWHIQPTHPALLEALAIGFEDADYDLRWLVRTIAVSSSYQLSSTYPWEWDTALVPYHPRHYPRRLGAEELFDALSMATGWPLDMQVLGWDQPVYWAVQLPDTLEPLLDWGPYLADFMATFGRGNRDNQLRSSDGSVIQPLRLMNDELVTERTRPEYHWTTTGLALASGLSPEQQVEYLFLASVSRRPTDAELASGLAIIDAALTWEDGLSDLMFALVNKIDFLFQH